MGVKQTCTSRAQNDVNDPTWTLAALANGEPVVKLSHYLLTDFRELGILGAVLAREGSDTI